MLAGLFGLHFAYWTGVLARIGVALGLVTGGALIFGYVFLFKLLSFMQSRIGPNEAGPYGVLQPLAEGIKFLQKEDLTPDNADSFVFKAAPVVVLISTFLLFMVVPGGPSAHIANFDTGIFFALAVSSVSTLGVLMAGWSSANKYSLIGALRAAGQLIAYELPLVLAVVGVVIMAGSMNLNTIVLSQRDFHMPFVIPQFIGFLIFLISVQAELTQAPFDMPVAESELVAGYQTEYSGFRFLLFFISEFASTVAYSALAATLFLGGWYAPGIDQLTPWAANLAGIGVLTAKIFFVGFLIFWLRFSYPRFREDQLQQFAWKILIPVSLANILVTAILKVVL